ncbi:MAG: AAA family ATPase, partial [bacterium]
MRIHRIHLKNFGGVVESDVSLQPKGVTIVQGPNETGKSTLIQAIDLLFDYRDDSRREDVRDVQPVNRDVGAEVEAELEIGGCRFTYFKRFNRDRETRLHILAPKVEDLTGREAHDRVQELLSASLDTALWKALRIVQGEKVDLPNLKGQPALAKALDRAAGQALTGDREEALFDTVSAEYLQYWTDTGKEKEDPLVKVRVAAALATNTVQDLQGKLSSLDAEVITHARLEREIATARQSLVDLEARVGTSQHAWDQVSKIRDDVERLRSVHEATVAKTSVAKIAEEERQRLIDSAMQFSERVDSLSTKEKTSQPAVEAATLKLAVALKARDQAKDAAERAEREETLRRMDRDFHQNKFDLALMEERLGRIVEADKVA